MNIESSDEDQIEPKDRRLILFWSGGLILFYAVIAIVIFVWIRKDKTAEELRLDALINSPTTELGETYVESPPPGRQAEATEVTVGVYLQNIHNLSLTDFNWVADFLVWFKWEGDELDPGETFSVVGGKIDQSEKVAEQTVGSAHYARYHVIAEIYKFFDVTLYPFNTYVLTIAIEDARYPVYQVRYLADAENSATSPRVRIVEGVSISNTAAMVKLHPYQTTLGMPETPAGYTPTFSTFIYGLWISSPGIRVFLKLFLALFISVLIAISVFFIKPIDVDPRVGLGVGALFAAVANSFIISSMLPPNASLILVDVVNGIGIITIFLTVLESIISLYLYEILEKEATSRALDRASFVIIMVGYALVNVLIPVAALI